MLPQTEYSGYHTQLLGEAQQCIIISPALKQRPSQRTPEKAPSVFMATARKRDEELASFKSTDPEKRLEEMLACGPQPGIHHAWPIRDENGRTVQWRLPDGQGSSRRFGFHNDARVNSSDSGLFTAVENDEDLVPERILDHDELKQINRVKAKHPGEYNSRFSDILTQNYMQEHSHNFEDASKIKIPSSQNSNIHQGISQPQRYSHIHPYPHNQEVRHSKLRADLRETLHDSHHIDNPTGVWSKVTQLQRKPHVTHTDFDTKRLPCPVHDEDLTFTTQSSCKEINSAGHTIQHFHQAENSQNDSLGTFLRQHHQLGESSFVQNPHPVNRVLPRQTNVTHDHMHHHTIERYLMQQDKHRQEPGRCTDQYQKPPIFTDTQYQQQATNPQGHQFQHDKGETLNNVQNKIKTKNERPQSKPFQESLHQTRREISQDLFTDGVTQSNQTQNPSPEQNKNIQHKRLNNGISTELDKTRKSKPTTVVARQNSKFSIETDCATDWLWRKTEHNQNTRKSPLVSPFLQEDATAQAATSSTNIRVRRRTKRASSKARKTSDR